MEKPELLKISQQDLDNLLQFHKDLRVSYQIRTTHELCVTYLKQLGPPFEYANVAVKILVSSDGHNILGPTLEFKDAESEEFFRRILKSPR